MLTEPTVLFVRHGTTGKDDILKGMMDPPLDDHGRELARQAGKRIAEFPVVSIQHSPLARAAETAAIIGKIVGVKPVEADALGPMDVGRLSGMDKDKATDWLRYYIQHPDKAPPGGKPLGPWFDAFAAHTRGEMAAAKKDPDGVRVNVTHSSESVNIPTILRGGDIEYKGTGSPDPGSILRLFHRGGRWQTRELD